MSSTQPTDRRRRRRRRSGGRPGRQPTTTPADALRTLTAVSAAALAAYGTYRLISWAWGEGSAAAAAAADDEEGEKREKREAREKREQVREGAASDDTATDGRETSANANSNSNPRSNADNADNADNGRNEPVTTITIGPTARRRYRSSSSGHRLARSHRLHRCRTEARSALTDFLPTLQRWIETRTDFAEATRELKQLRKLRGERARRRAARESKESRESKEERKAAGKSNAGVNGSAAKPPPQDNATTTTNNNNNNNNSNNNNSSQHQNEDPIIANTEEQDEEHEEHTQRLREAQLWERIKSSSLTRLVTATYGHSVLMLVLTVQVNLLGGRLFQDEMEEMAAGQNQKERRERREESKGTTTTAAAAEEIEIPIDHGSVAASSLGLASQTMMGPTARPTGTTSSQRSQATLTPSSSSSSSYQSTHRTVLTRTYRHLFSAGMAALLNVVEGAVTDAFAEYEVTDPDRMNVTGEEFDECVRRVREAVEGGGGGGIRRGGDGGGRVARRQRQGRRAALVRFVVPPGAVGDQAATAQELGTGGEGGSEAVVGIGSAADADGGDDDVMAQHILEETWDVLESPTYAAAEREVLDVTFAMLSEGGWGGIFPPRGLRSVASDGRSALGTGTGTPTASRPLAQVVTQLRRTVNTFYIGAGGNASSSGMRGAAPAASNAYVPALERLASVAELGDAAFD